MCDDTAEFTTITGRRSRVQQLMEQWEHLRLLTGEHLWERDIRIRWYDLAELGHEYADPDCAAVAVAFHAQGGSRAAASIRSALLLADEEGFAGLLCEPGHHYSGEDAHGGGGSIQLDQAQLRRAAASLTPTRECWSARVALLDTGDTASDQAPLDFTLGWPRPGEPGSDPHGHGSAVAATVRAVAPDAEITPIQVLDHHCSGTSHAIYQGLVAALWSGQGYDVVNASLSVQATSSCGTSLGTTFQHLMALRKKTWTGPPPPRLVVAAGNNVAQLRAPASVDGARVVVATDFAGQTAPYCATLDLPAGVDSAQAPGGLAGDPLGHYANGTEIYGTSFAAGFVSGSLLNQ